MCSSHPLCLSSGGTQFPHTNLMQEVQMEPRSHLWVGLDPHSTAGMDIFTLDLCPGPFSAAPTVVRWWSLQQRDLAQTSQLLTAAHGACFPGTVIHCCEASEAGEEEGVGSSLKGEAPQPSHAGSKWEFVSCPCSQCGKQFCSPTATAGPQLWPQRGLTSLQAHHKAV